MFCCVRRNIVFATATASPSATWPRNACCCTRTPAARCDALSAGCSTNGLRPRRQHFANSLEQILEMVQASLGVSLAGERLPAAVPVLRRPIEVEQAGRSIVLAVVAGRQLGPTPALCIKLMRARAWVQDTKAEAA